MIRVMPHTTLHYRMHTLDPKFKFSTPLEIVGSFFVYEYPKKSLNK